MWKYELLIYWFECWMFEGKVDVWLFGDEMFGVIEFVCFVLQWVCELFDLYVFVVCVCDDGCELWFVMVVYDVQWCVCKICSEWCSEGMVFCGQLCVCVLIFVCFCCVYDWYGGYVVCEFMVCGVLC